MVQNVEEVQEQLSTAASLAERNEILRRAGVSIPTGEKPAPFEPVRLRPRWLACLLRLVRYPD
jgi:hypothetical protein